MSFSSRADAIRQRSSPKSQVIFAFVFSGIGDLFLFVGLLFAKLRRVCGFFSLNACSYATAAVENNTAGQSIILRYGTAGCA